VQKYVVFLFTLKYNQTNATINIPSYDHVQINLSTAANPGTGSHVFKAHMKTRFIRPHLTQSVQKNAEISRNSMAKIA